MKDLINKKNESEGLLFLSCIHNETIDCCFFDPQYKGAVNKMGKKSQKRNINRMQLNQMEDSTIVDFMKEINRCLKPSKHLFFWLDTYHLINNVKNWSLESNFEIVDLLTWNKVNMGMGTRLRRQSEFCVILQKKPKRVDGFWFKNNIRSVFTQKPQNNKHTHAKPIDLQKTLIEAVTKHNDIVLDPTAGSFSVFEACKQTKRNFLGCDIKIKKEVMNDLVDFM